MLHVSNRYEVLLSAEIFLSEPLNGLVVSGVEDDGCHSLLDYESVAESARVLGELFYAFVFLCVAESDDSLTGEGKRVLSSQPERCCLGKEDDTRGSCTRRRR